MLDFQHFIGACGFEPPDRIEPGRIVRFSTNGRRGDDAGWALLFLDGEGGVVGDFRSGEQHVWQAEAGTDPSPEDTFKRQQRIEEAQRAADAARKQGYEEAAKRASEIWATCTTAPADHPYLVKKNVGVHGARIYRGDLVIGGMKCDGALVIAARNTSGALHSLQFITTEDKRYLPRGEIEAHCFFMGLQSGKPTAKLCVVEGFATGASVNESTGYTTVVAFDAGNLMPVAKALREKYQQQDIIICADNDVGVKSGKVDNPGVHYARAAAEAISARIAVPELTSGAKCDFNDLAVQSGNDVVRMAVDPTQSQTGLIVRVDDTAFLRHMVEKEGRSLQKPSAYRDEVRARLAGQLKREGARMPWAKTHGQIVFQQKQVSIWAGINGHGKSAVLNQVIAEFAVQGHKSWLASLEMPVAATLERMVRQASGVMMPSSEYIDAFHDWIDGRLFLHDHIGRESSKKMVAMIRFVHEKTGCQHYIIDSMMRVVRSPDDYAGQKDFIEMMCATAHDLGIHIHVVMHMRKGESEYEQVGKFDIKGASEISDLVDNVFIVWRNKLKEKKLQDANAPDRGAFLTAPDTILTCDKQRHGDWEGDINLWYESASKAYHGSSERNEWQVSPKVLGIADHVPF